MAETRDEQPVGVFTRSERGTDAQSRRRVKLIVWNCLLFKMSSWLHKWILYEDARQIGFARKEAHSSLLQRERIGADTTNWTGSSWSMTVPTATLLIQYLRLRNKLPARRRLPPTSRPTNFGWTLTHVTQWATQDWGQIMITAGPLTRQISALKQTPVSAAQCQC